MLFPNPQFHMPKESIRSIYLSKKTSERETFSFNPAFSPFHIVDGRIASSMAVYHSTIFCC